MKNDVQLQKDVIQELTWSPDVNQTHIGVSVERGVVTLSGTVPTFAEKAAAEKAALRVSGVKAVTEKIEVKLPWKLERTDSDIAEAAYRALEWNILVPDDRVKVSVEKGTIQLSGEVEWEYQREAALEAVKNLNGVRYVENKIMLKAKVKPADVKEKIQAALERAVDREARKINVDVSGSKVTLSGTVRSFADLRDAKGAAFNAPGVTEVECNLSLAA